jgi:hypothetical protein
LNFLPPVAGSEKAGIFRSTEAVLDDFGIGVLRLPFSSFVKTDSSGVRTLLSSGFQRFENSIQIELIAEIHELFAQRGNVNLRRQMCDELH